MIELLIVSGFLFLMGAAVGSFLNVFIMRTLTDENWVMGRSHCDHCGKPIAWYDMIPVFSYLWLRGSCRRCREPISLSHPVIESITGILFVWWYWSGSLFFRLTAAPLQTLQPLFWLLVGIFLLLIFFADWLYYVIPDLAVIGLLLLTIVYRLTLVGLGEMQLQDLGWSLVGTVLATGLLALLYWITKGKGMGLGDVKLMVPLSLLMGWPRVIVGVFLAFLLGAVIALGMVAVRRKKFGQVIAFGPFLVVATAITLVWGEALVAWYWSLL